MSTMKTTTYSLQVNVLGLTGKPAYWTQSQSWTAPDDQDMDTAVAVLARAKAQHPTRAYRLVRTVQESMVLVWDEDLAVDIVAHDSWRTWKPLEE